MTRRFKFNIWTVLAVSSGSFFSAVAMADGEEDGTERPGIAEVSIWDDLAVQPWNRRPVMREGLQDLLRSGTVQPPIHGPAPGAADRSRNRPGLGVAGSPANDSVLMSDHDSGASLSPKNPATR